MPTLQELADSAGVIAGETTAKANTAARVGGLFQDVVTYLAANAPLTADQYDAINAATAPDNGNPFATIADVLAAVVQPLFQVRTVAGVTTKYPTIAAAIAAAGATDTIYCYTDVTWPISALDRRVIMPGYTLTLQTDTQLDADITAQKIIAPGAPSFTGGGRTIRGFLETTELNLAAATFTLIGGGTGRIIFSAGGALILQDGHWGVIVGGMPDSSVFDGGAGTPVTLRNASFSGGVGGVRIIDEDGLGRSTAVTIAESSSTLDLTALDYVPEVVAITGNPNLDTIVGYDVPRNLRMVYATGTGNAYTLVTTPEASVIADGFVLGSVLGYSIAGGGDEVRMTPVMVDTFRGWRVIGSPNG